MNWNEVFSSKSGYLKPTQIGIKYQRKPKLRLFTRFKCRGKTNPLIQKGSFIRTKIWSSSTTSKKLKLERMFWKKLILVPTNFLGFIVHYQLVHSQLRLSSTFCFLCWLGCLLLRCFKLLQACFMFTSSHALQTMMSTQFVWGMLFTNLVLILFLIVMLFIITLILVLFVTMKLMFSNFFLFGNGGHGGNVHMTSGGNEFITFIIIAMVGITLFF